MCGQKIIFRTHASNVRLMTTIRYLDDDVLEDMTRRLAVPDRNTTEDRQRVSAVSMIALQYLKVIGRNHCLLLVFA